MSVWSSYNPNIKLTPAKQVIGATLEYLKHTVRESNFQKDDTYAIVNVMHYLLDENGEHALATPMMITVNSKPIIRFLDHVGTNRKTGERVFFRLTYDENGKDLGKGKGKLKWGVEEAEPPMFDNENSDVAF